MDGTAAPGQGTAAALPSHGGSRQGARVSHPSTSHGVSTAAYIPVPAARGPSCSAAVDAALPALPACPALPTARGSGRARDPATVAHTEPA